METIDVLQYKPVIQQTLVKMKVPRNQREDMTQECYMALLQKIKPGDTEGYVAAICRSTVADVWKKENQTRASYVEKPNIHFDSLSDPRTAHKASKVMVPESTDVPDEVLYPTIDELPDEERNVIYRLFIEGKTQEQTGAELGLTRSAVRTRSQRGIDMLKKIFEVG